MKYLVALTTIIVLLSCSATKNAGSKKTADQTQAVLAEVLQQKQADGTDFYAKGAVPSSWSVEIDFDKIIRFKSLDGADVLSTPVKAVEHPSGNSVTYTTRAGNGEMIISLFKEACTDALSGEKFNQKVTVDVNGKHYEGCGQYLSDAALNGTWILEKVGSREVTAAEFAKGLPEINFDINGGSITGHDGCNRITGQMQVQGNQIKFAAIGGTKMACPGNKPMNNFVGKLSNAFASYYFKDGRLFLYLMDDSTVVFKKG